MMVSLSPVRAFCTLIRLKALNSFNSLKALYALRAAPTIWLMFDRNPLMSPLLSAIRNPSYRLLADSISRPHVSMVWRLLFIASLKTDNAPFAAATAVPITVSLLAFSPNALARSFTLMDAESLTRDVSPISLFVSLSCCLVSVIRPFNWSRLSVIAFPIGDCFSASVSCLYCIDNSTYACFISFSLPVAERLTVSI